MVDSRYTVHVMLKLSDAITDQLVLSLRTGSPIAVTLGPIIDPNNLKIVGFHCQEQGNKKQPTILLTQDIREWIPQGFAVNDHDVLSPPDDLVRLQPIIKIGFELIGKAVYTKNKKRLGKVNDYAVDDTSLMVQKIYVGQNILKNLTGSGLSIDRNQIIEITDKRIVVQDPLQGVPHTALSGMNA